MAEREVVFVDAVRTAFGRMGGTIRDFTAAELAGICIKGLVDKTKIKEKAHVDTVMMGCAAHDSKAMNPARWSALYAGLGYETSASYVEMQCGSAIDSINHSAWKIKCNQADIIIAGGSEAYSQIPVKFSMSVPPYKLIPPMPLPQMLSPVEEECIGMGITAENLQKMYDVPREASDEFAYNSQMRSKMAWDKGYFDGEIVPVTIPATRKTPEFAFEKDEHPRFDTTLEGLAKLRPAFTKDGTVTAGNASGRNDGAAFVLMMSAEKAEELGYTPMARWVAGADYGVDPRIMGIGPAYAVVNMLKRTGLKISDMDVMECNEAFAVQNLAVIKEIEKQMGETIDMEKWNPMGGAIAYGHPNGASGARIGMFCMRELIRRGGRYGFFSSCCGGGLGVATLIENLQK
ncbi:acetyl-CoA C-acetyltransferase [Desulfatibacillum alkenivorans DSM 16219]|jgi:acetyl-CoA C-acetyltransferase|uniref:acetyl-CoA C-acyltransferase n=1 Tax=Desulfatibacillum alkenivorans DSM 16219 TaxID=1121393 RepID=A0A1M6L713_9BACT|nr:thiolase family protein [Desulfatibacillum alkenivorans]SHJ67038.1 acetyl-CoA C-acetyltransferase [Desulfatibacillum alkenivorans DSM 16219]